MKSAISIDVAAEPGVVFALASNVERWATLLPHYRRSRRVAANADGSLVVQFVALRPIGPLDAYGLPVMWRARTWSEPASCRLRFLHLGGATAGMDVTWRIEPAGGGSTVTIEHDFPAPPGWALFIDRFFTRPIASRTLATFGALAAAVQSGSLAATKSPS
jgi:polyketide cyclase/dehydrase/lipid transport protein